MKTSLVFLLLAASSWEHPSPRGANSCIPSLCKIEDDCRCSSFGNPFNSAADPAPQVSYSVSVSESVVKSVYDSYWRPLLLNRKNPDGRPIGASFYVNHEYTDYTLVQDLYVRGFEIGVHSITKNFSQEYWRYASFDTLVQEFHGQRQIISHFANIPIGDIVGARTPQLQLEGDLSIDAYVEAGITYDNSWPTSSNKLLLPYTLDYASVQECLVTMTCPFESHSHFWIAPITDIKGKNNMECNSLAACWITGTSEQIAAWLVAEVERLRTSSRNPLVLRLDSFWFQNTANSSKGFDLFMNEMLQKNDVFFVSVGDILKWTKNPVSLKDFQSSSYSRKADCRPRTCFYNSQEWEAGERVLTQCGQCPYQYPWLGNPFGDII